jgi:hypothetical protein
MSFGVNILLNNGRVIDSSKLTGLVHDLFVVGGGTSGTKGYPELAGYIIYAAVQKFISSPAGVITANVSYAFGYPSVNWSPTGSGDGVANATILVFVK